MKTKRARMLLALLCAASLGSPPAFAQRGNDQGHGQGQWQHGGGPHGQGAGFQGHYGGYYGGHNGGAWRGGHWEHGRVGGRTMWWWAAGPAWYYYPTPVYPYSYSYPYAYPYSYPYPWVPPSVAGAPLVSPAAPYWYYCDAAPGYYPYVTQCPGGFRAIAPSDPNAPAPNPGVQ